jgi:hypothetical protein
MRKLERHGKQSPGSLALHTDPSAFDKSFKSNKLVASWRRGRELGSNSAPREDDARCIWAPASGTAEIAGVLRTRVILFCVANSSQSVWGWSTELKAEFLAEFPWPERPYCNGPNGQP